jgi:hypothetical protein
MPRSKHGPADKRRPYISKINCSGLLAFALGSLSLNSSLSTSPNPMPKILYTVRATLPSVQLRGRFLSWLVPDHVMAVKAGGAEAVRVVLPDRAADNAPATVETQYVFPSRKAFDIYVRDHAPALRADGLKHFPPATGIVFERQVAEIAAELE